MDEIYFFLTKNWDIESIIQLYKDAGWWKNEYNSDEIPFLIESSFLFTIGISIQSKKTIAMGRILSDGFCGIIQDMCVLSECRGQGIGSKLLQFMVHSAINAGISRILLVAEPGTSSFYIKSGFILQKNKTFLLQTI